jgi:hypothetical protein
MSLSPEVASTIASSERKVRSGSLTVNWLPIRMPGIEPTRSQPTVGRETFPATRCPMPATQSSAAA